jgi:TRAP-type C4-dicarboxylate transport system permease small subunit
MIGRFIALSRRLSRAGAWVASALIIALVVLITVEIVGRSFFDTSTMLADEYSGYFYLALVYLGLAYTFDQNGHIRIRLLTDRLTRKGRKWADIFAGILTAIMLFYALVYSWRFMRESYTMEMVSEGVSETPLYLTQIPIVVGLGLFVLSVIAFVVRRGYDDQ